MYEKGRERKRKKEIIEEERWKGVREREKFLFV